MSPVINQTARSHPPEPTVRAMSALTIKMPDPIIDPTTSMVAPYRPRALLNWGEESLIPYLHRMG
jgi:hypothetical protein